MAHPWVRLKKRSVLLITPTRRLTLLGPNITTVATDVAALDCLCDIFCNADGTTSGIDDPGTLLHPAEFLLVDQAHCAFVQRSIDSEDVDFRQELLEVFNANGANFLFGVLGQRLVVVVCELGAVEWLEALQDAEANTAGAERANNLAFEVKLWARVSQNLILVPGFTYGVLGDLSNFPATRFDLFMPNIVVAANLSSIEAFTSKIAAYRTKSKIVMTTCSATETTLEPVTSATRILRSFAAFRSMWSVRH